MFVDLEVLCEKVELEDFGGYKRVKLSGVDEDDLVEAFVKSMRSVLSEGRGSRVYGYSDDYLRSKIRKILG